MKRFLAIMPLYAFALGAPVSVAAGNVAAGLIMAWAVLRVATEREARPWQDVPVGILVALAAYFLAHAAATALSAPAPIRWNKLGEEMWLKLLLVAVPIVAYGRRGAIVRAAGLLIASGLVAAAYGVFQHFTGRDLIRGVTTYPEGSGYTAVAFFGHHLTYGGQVLLLLIVAAALLRQRAFEGPRRAWPAATACALLLLALMWSYARSSQLGAVAAALVLVWSLPRRWRLPAVVSVVAVMALALAAPSVRARVAETFTDQKEVTRPNLWRSSLAGIADRPLLGWGPGNFDAMLAKHEIPGAFYESRAHAHNDFLMHAVNAGLVGLAAALALLALTTRAAWRRWQQRGSWVALAAAAAQVGISIAGLFQVYQTDDEVEMVLYFLLGCALAAPALYAPREDVVS